MPSPTPIVDNCHKCKWWWIKAATDTKGECHKHAPHPAAGSDKYQGWPTCFNVDWCGEWEKK